MPYSEIAQEYDAQKPERGSGHHDQDEGSLGKEVTR